MRHAQFLKSPIVHDCLKANIDGPNRPQIVPKLLLQVTII